MDERSAATIIAGPQAGTGIVRLLPNEDCRHLDPIAFLEMIGPLEADGDQIRPPQQAYRGVHVLTLVLRGTVEYRDSLGNHEILRAGAMGWLMSGSGVVTEETLTADDEGVLHVARVGVTLSPADKAIEPWFWPPLSSSPVEPVPGRTRFPRDMPPWFDHPEDGFSLRLYSGWWAQAGTELRGDAEIDVLERVVQVVLEPHGSTSMGAPRSWGTGESPATVVVCVLAGIIDTAGHRGLTAGSVVVYADDGDQIDLASSTGGEALIIMGAPRGEPIITDHGFVAPTDDELISAWSDYGAGRMGLLPPQP